MNAFEVQSEASYTCVLPWVLFPSFMKISLDRVFTSLGIMEMGYEL